MFPQSSFVFSLTINIYFAILLYQSGRDLKKRGGGCNVDICLTINQLRDKKFLFVRRKHFLVIYVLDNKHFQNSQILMSVLLTMFGRWSVCGWIQYVYMQLSCCLVWPKVWNKWSYLLRGVLFWKTRPKSSSSSLYFCNHLPFSHWHKFSFHNTIIVVRKRTKRKSRGSHVRTDKASHLVDFHA